MSTDALVRRLRGELAGRDTRIAELERLAYFYSPSDPFCPDGTTWKQHLEDRVLECMELLRLLYGKAQHDPTCILTEHPERSSAECTCGLNDLAVKVIARLKEQRHYERP